MTQETHLPFELNLSTLSSMFAAISLLVCTCVRDLRMWDNLSCRVQKRYVMAVSNRPPTSQEVEEHLHSINLACQDAFSTLCPLQAYFIQLQRGVHVHSGAYLLHAIHNAEEKNRQKHSQEQIYTHSLLK